MKTQYDLTLTADEGTGREFTLSLDVWLQGAEPDVGIMSAYVDDWDITGFNGKYDKRNIERIRRFINARPKLDEAINEALNEAEFD